MKPDSMLPFAIAAVLGFLVLGLRGGESRLDFSTATEPARIAQDRPDHKVEASKNFQSLQIVKRYPNDPRQWQLLDTFPDGTISFSDSNPDSMIPNVSGSSEH